MHCRFIVYHLSHALNLGIVFIEKKNFIMQSIVELKYVIKLIINKYIVYIYIEIWEASDLPSNYLLMVNILLYKGPCETLLAIQFADTYV